MMNGRCPRGHSTVTMSLGDEDCDFDNDVCGGPGDDHDIITMQLNLKLIIAYVSQVVL